jgi:2-polyprenyl-3-methyl-5-hydroxy-6-metoxy-1,4-benzoquinol methylase
MLLLIDLSQRHIEGELMDAPDLAEQQHMLALKGLQRVNLFSGTANVVATAIHRVWKTQSAPVHILDLACGGGDVTLHVAKRLRRLGVHAEMHGWDRSSTAIDFARQQAKIAGVHVDFKIADALAEIAPQSFDVIYCTLFLHHLTNSESRNLLTQMYRGARKLVLIDDLRRSATGYGLAVVGCRLLSRSPIVHVDGPLSVRAAYTDKEILSLSDQCGLPRPEVRRHWPHRFLISWNRS